MTCRNIIYDNIIACFGDYPRAEMSIRDATSVMPLGNLISR